MNEISFEDIYKKYVNFALKTAMYYCGNQNLAEDIVQQTFAKLFVNYDTIRNKDAIGKWLITTIRHAAYSHGRKRKHEIPTEDKELKEYVNKGKTELEEIIFMEERRIQAKQLTDDLMEALYEHNPKWYDAVVKAYILEMPQKVIAEEMGIRLEAFQSMLFRAKKWIIKKYETQYRKIE